ncbi:MAG: hypothetical protein IJX99_00650 [Clostridia bacterium]|nr:hypothetical protein [Clostridia bacterium]
MNNKVKDNGISLPQIPKEKEYEDFIAAILQAGGYYLERGIIHRIKQDVLELDIVTTRFHKDHLEHTISEIKSGGWGFSDIFKVRGWLDYLDLNKATFIVQEPNQTMEISKDVAAKINVALINNENLDCTELLNVYSIDKNTITEEVIESYRYAFALEAEMVLYLHCRAKSDPAKQGFQALEKFLFEINSNSFFENKPVNRLNKVFRAYKEYKNITARIAEELENKPYPNSGDGLAINKPQFEKIFYKAQAKSVLYVALYAELLARLTILKSCIEDILIGPTTDFSERIQHFILPENIKNALREFLNEPYSYLYPYFWQVFIYLFGGFILNDKKDEEYKLLSSTTKIPINEIPNAFKAFDKLFPLGENKSWFIQQPYTQITVMQFFPLPLSGIGANFRRIIYKNDLDASYENLSKQLSKGHSIDDIIKWNNLAYAFLNSSKRKKKP